MVLVLQRRVLVMGPRIILRGAIPLDSNIGGFGHRPLLRERTELALLVCGCFCFPFVFPFLLCCPVCLVSFCLGFGGRAVQPVSRAVLPLIPGCAAPVGLLSVLGRLYRPFSLGLLRPVLPVVSGRYFRCPSGNGSTAHYNLSAPDLRYNRS